MGKWNFSRLYDITNFSLFFCVEVIIIISTVTVGEGWGVGRAFMPGSDRTTLIVLITTLWPEILSSAHKHKHVLSNLMTCAPAHVHRNWHLLSSNATQCFRIILYIIYRNKPRCVLKRVWKAFRLQLWQQSFICTSFCLYFSPDLLPTCNTYSLSPPTASSLLDHHHPS